ncbi:MAG TPA: dihydrofolate reductase [Glaciibacter sp.]|nr:dihydrofolate reductase [Glaciibacter sp.]
MTIGLVWAEARGVIGHDGVLPWHLPEDLAHFKAITLGGAVIMGRRTWDSLPQRFRPLPDRTNIVVTRQVGWRADGVRTANSVDDALEHAGDLPAWVIGGAEIFALTIDQADSLDVTEIDSDIPGDTRAPSIGSGWTIARADPAEGWHRSRTGLDYRFIRYERAPRP